MILNAQIALRSVQDCHLTCCIFIAPSEQTPLHVTTINSSMEFYISNFVNNELIIMDLSFG